VKWNLKYILLAFFFLAVLWFELSAYTLSYFIALFFDGFFEIGSHKLIAWAGLNCNFPDLCLLSCKDYRCDPPAPGNILLLVSPLPQATIIFIVSFINKNFPVRNLHSQYQQLNLSRVSLYPTSDFYTLYSTNVTSFKISPVAFA
jgi:hypothetical protein